MPFNIFITKNKIMQVPQKRGGERSEASGEGRKGASGEGSSGEKGSRGI